MKVETKTTYIAEDGKEFKTEEDCIFHEILSKFQEKYHYSGYPDNSFQEKLKYLQPEELGFLLMSGKI